MYLLSNYVFYGPQGSEDVVLILSMQGRLVEIG